MPPLEHLPLIRYTREEPRRKRPGFSAPPTRDPGQHGRRIGIEIDQVMATARARPQIQGIDPALILKVELTNQVDEDAWRRAGFQVLAQEPGQILVLFATDAELTDFRRQLAAFQQGPPPGRVAAPHNALFSSIERALPIPPADRIGPRLRARGIGNPAAIDGRHVFVVDIELWDADTALDRRVRAQRVDDHIQAAGGEVIGVPYVGNHGLILIRARMRGQLLRALLDLDVIALVDLPPMPDLTDDNPQALGIADIPDPVLPPDDAPLIGIIDSGLNAHPLLDDIVTGRHCVPHDLGAADAKGHGTRVAGIAAYGDVRECIDRQHFGSPVRLLSVRVLTDRGAFPDHLTLPDQMRQAITWLAEAGCRIINISLGDGAYIPYADGRATPWTAELDTLVRELDVVIVVSAGNANSRDPAWGPDPEAITQHYPAYLLEPQSRLIDPAMAVNVVTVGALAHGNGLRVDPLDGAEIRTLTETDDPSPVTRTGPGINGAIKPDFVEHGGTFVWNGATQRIVTGEHWANAGMLSLGSDYLRSLFVAGTGTSYAAPRLAYKAALIIRRYPDASANLVRALLGVSADVSLAARARMTPPNHEARALAPEVRRTVGYGTADPFRAIDSDDSRVVFYADAQELELDQMALYAIPMPEVFATTPGVRSIRVALAFDPPVRHTRLEYLGTRMSFQLVRRMTPDQIFDQYRRREDHARPPALAGRYKCDMDPGLTARQTSTLQCARYDMARNFDAQGEMFHLAVFSHRRWAGDDIQHQRYAVVVELAHQACADLHQECSRIVLELEQRVDIRL